MASAGRSKQRWFLTAHEEGGMALGAGIVRLLYTSPRSKTTTGMSRASFLLHHPTRIPTQTSPTPPSRKQKKKSQGH